jgi:hypothetical protein
MRSICKKGSATLVAVLALCALASASASASQFYVGGKALTGTAALSTSVKVEEPIVISATWGSNHLVVTCRQASLHKGSNEIEAPGTLKTEWGDFASCTMTGLEECSMGSEIGFEALKGELSTATSPEDAISFKPTNKNDLLTKLPFKGECFAVGDTDIVGSLAMKVVKGQEEKTEQEFVGEGTAGKGLEVVGWGQPHPPAYVTGKLKLKLESGSAWSYH